MAENQRDAKFSLRPFYKEFERALSFGQMALKQACTFFGEAIQQKPRTSAVSLGSLAMEMCFKLWRMGQKWPKTSDTQSLPLGHFIKSWRGL